MAQVAQKMTTLDGGLRGLEKTNRTILRATPRVEGVNMWKIILAVAFVLAVTANCDAQNYWHHHNGQYHSHPHTHYHYHNYPPVIGYQPYVQWYSYGTYYSPRAYVDRQRRNVIIGGYSWWSTNQGYYNFPYVIR